MEYLERKPEKKQFFFARKWNEGVVESAAMAEREHFLHSHQVFILQCMSDYRPMLDDDEHDVIIIIKFY